MSNEELLLKAHSLRDTIKSSQDYCELVENAVPLAIDLASDWKQTHEGICHPLDDVFIDDEDECGVISWNFSTVVSEIRNSNDIETSKQFFINTTDEQRTICRNVLVQFASEAIALLSIEIGLTERGLTS